MAVTTFPEAPFEFAMFDWIENSGRPVADIVEHKMRLVEMADRAGFYAWHTAQHQATPLSLNISPSILLAAAIQRTQNLHVGALTFCLPWYDPYRFYNEVCMLDQMSRGRVELGVGRGISLLESSVYGIDDVEESRGRYRETLDIFFNACGKDTLEHEGNYFNYHDVELHTAPYQKPYPPLWFPSSSPDIIDFVARHGYNTAIPGAPENVRPMLEQYRETWLEHQDDEGRHNAHVAAPRLGRNQHIFVAETDAEAEAIAGPAMAEWAAHISHLSRKHSASLTAAPQPDRSTRVVIAGSPETVAERLIESIEVSGINYCILVFSFGDLPPERSERSLELFISDVMPAVRAGLDPDGTASASGHGA
ncbi:MAG: LLM class flavin-dependent oxidoreductase [Chloroflexi bacterium]|nr:LLM class flavin-dependent oxidoreductase [Chloroflexota bacterium]